MQIANVSKDYRSEIDAAFAVFKVSDMERNLSEESGTLYQMLVVALDFLPLPSVTNYKRNSN